MVRIVIAVIVASAFAALDTAAAASKPKKPKVRPAPIVTVPVTPLVRTPGPPWGLPGQCFTDEGYGRYLPCDAGMDM